MAAAAKVFSIQGPFSPFFSCALSKRNKIQSAVWTRAKECSSYFFLPRCVVVSEPLLIDRRPPAVYVSIAFEVKRPIFPSASFSIGGGGPWEEEEDEAEEESVIESSAY